MKRNLLFVSFIILAILFTGCSFKDYNSAYKNEEGYSNYISNSKTGCKDMNSFGLVSNLEDEKSQEYYKKNSRVCGDYLITNYLDGVCINRYLGHNNTIKIPKTLDNKPVIMLGNFISNEKYNGKNQIYGAFAGIKDCKITIPSTVKYVTSDVLWVSCDGDTTGFTSKYENDFASVKIDKNNPYYTYIDNIIYTKDMKTLLYINFYDYYNNEDGEDFYIVVDNIENFEPINQMLYGNYQIYFGKNIKKIDADFGTDNSGNVLVYCYKGTVAEKWAKNKGIYYAFNDNDTTTSDVGAVPGPYGADEYDKKYSKVWKSDDGKFSFTCDNKKRLNGRGEYKATYKGKDNLINIWVEGNGEPKCLGIDTDTNDGDSLFGGEYTYNGNDKNSITVVIDYVYRKRVAKAGLDSIKKGDKIVFHQE